MVTTEAFTRSTRGATERPVSAGVGTAATEGRAVRTVKVAHAKRMRPPPLARVSTRSCRCNRRKRLSAIDDNAAVRVIGGQGDGNLVAEHDTDPVLTQLASEVGQDLVPVLELDLEVARRQNFDHSALELDMLFAAHFRGC